MRIGYVSADWGHRHPLTHLMSGALAHHNRKVLVAIQRDSIPPRTSPCVRRRNLLSSVMPCKPMMAFQPLIACTVIVVCRFRNLLVRPILTRAKDSVVNLEGMDDAQAAGRINHDQVHLLIDLNGYTFGRLTTLFPSCSRVCMIDRLPAGNICLEALPCASTTQLLF